MVTRTNPATSSRPTPTLQKQVRRTASGVLGLHGERMSKVDTAWLRMDSPSNLMMIVGVWTLQPGISFDALCERVQERLLKSCYSNILILNILLMWSGGARFQEQCCISLSL